MTSARWFSCLHCVALGRSLLLFANAIVIESSSDTSCGSVHDEDVAVCASDYESPISLMQRMLEVSPSIKQNGDTGVGATISNFLDSVPDADREASELIVGEQTNVVEQSIQQDVQDTLPRSSHIVKNISADREVSDLKTYKHKEGLDLTSSDQSKVIEISFEQMLSFTGLAARTSVSWPVLLLAVPVAVILVLVFVVVLTKLLCPTALFKIQTPPGFILHAMTGGKIPPYFWHWPFEDKYFGEWCRDGDVVVCVAAKSGTTWLMNIVHQIRTLGDPKEFLKHNTHTMPWPECARYPGETIQESLDALKSFDGMTNPEYPFRVFKSHYKPRVEGVPWKEAIKTDAVVPVRERRGVKYIICMREGKDVLKSFYPFFASHKPEFKEMWGGFPPSFNNFDECFKFFTEDIPGFYHGYAAQWWPYRNEKNVLLLHYNDLKHDIKGSLKKIADFVGIEVPKSAWPMIEEKVSLKWMKENEHKFKYDITSEYYQGNVISDAEGAMIRKGEVGEGKDALTPEQEKTWQELNDKFFKGQPGLAKWILTGGPLPP